MPQERKHATSAARQAAYRVRCVQVRRQRTSAKGLPTLPSVPSMPGWPRWNATFRLAHALMDAAVSELQDYFDDRSESWQESDRGEVHQQRIESAEAVLEALEPLIS